MPSVIQSSQPMADAGLKHAQEKSLPLYLPRDIENVETHIPPEEIPPLQAMLTWIREFIMRPHPQLGRTGDVCPFVNPSMKQDKCFFAVGYPQDSANADDIFQVVMAYAERFKLMDRRFQTSSGEPHDSLLTYVLVFPDIPSENTAALMEPLHKRLKTELLTMDLMVGQFYPSCHIGASRNPDFRPLQSPVPAYVLRTFIESDWRFIQGHKPWESMYIEHFGKSG